MNKGGSITFQGSGQLVSCIESICLCILSDGILLNKYYLYKIINVLPWVCYKRILRYL